MSKLLTARQAADRLGVKVTSLYAYVSRGELSNQRKPGTRASLFLESDIERLCERGRSSRNQPESELVIRTNLSAISDGDVYYRGRRVTALASSVSFERAAEWLWSGDPGVFNAALPSWQAEPSTVEAAKRSQQALPEETPIADRVRLVVAACAPLDAFRYSLDDVGAAHVTRTLLANVVHALPERSPSPAVSHLPGGEPLALASALWHRLSADAPPDGMIAVLNAALVLLCDHELATSTFAARVAASGRADPYSIVLAGLGAVAGSLHAGMGPRIAEIFAQVTRPADAVPVVAEYLRHHTGLPGLGHPLYDNGDPRGRVLLEQLRALSLTRSQARRLEGAEAVLQVACSRARALPNVDFALACLCHIARMPPSACEGIFAIARIAGWIAHAMEEYHEPPLRFRLRGAYTGPPLSSGAT